MNHEEFVIFNRYYVQRKLGEGSVGAAYLAEDTVKQERVVIKIIHEDLIQQAGGLEALTPILRDACHLSHPGIARIYDFNQWEGQVFLSTEYLQGETLRQHLDSGSGREGIGIDQTISIIHRLLLALENGARRTPHFALKPENIWLLQDARIKLSDFGLNAILDSAPYLTTASMLGAQSYVAPECYQPSFKLDERSEQYSLALIWLECLTGMRIQSLSSLDSHLQGMPKSISGIIEKMLAPDPDDRFSNWTQFRERLELVLEVKTKKQPLWARRRIQFSKTTKKILSGIGAALALAALVLFYEKPTSDVYEADHTNLSSLRIEWRELNFQRTQIAQETTQVPDIEDWLVPCLDSDRDWEILDDWFRLRYESKLSDDEEAVLKEEIHRRLGEAKLQLNTVKQIIQDYKQSKQISQIGTQLNAMYPNIFGDDLLNATNQISGFIDQLKTCRHTSAGGSVSTMLEALISEQEAAWDSWYAIIRDLKSQWKSILDSFSLPYIEPNEDLTSRIEEAQALKKTGRWAEAAAELIHVQKTLAAWIFEMKLAPEPAELIWQNSLGMRFTKVKHLKVSIWETRVLDFAVFVHETGSDIRFMWRDAALEQGPAHPARSVNIVDSKRFCQWLTERERRLGLISANEVYRLPTDREWSTTVGLPDEPGEWPEDRNWLMWDYWPWGTEPKRRKDSGNYATWPTINAPNNFFGMNHPIRFMDPYIKTSPVGQFPPNEHGLYDMGGNVWEWVSGKISQNSATDWRHGNVIRGGGWRTINLNRMRSTSRQNGDGFGDETGFRCVLAKVPE